MNYPTHSITNDLNLISISPQTSTSSTRSLHIPENLDKDKDNVDSNGDSGNMVSLLSFCNLMRSALLCNHLKEQCSDYYFLPSNQYKTVSSSSATDSLEEGDHGKCPLASKSLKPNYQGWEAMDMDGSQVGSQARQVDSNGDTRNMVSLFSFYNLMRSSCMTPSLIL